MLYYKYLKEIQNHLIILVLTWLSIIIICYIYKELILYYLIKPLLYLNNNKPFYFIFTNLIDIFNTYIRIIFFFSNKLLIFYTTYHLILFLTPALYFKEYKIIKIITQSFLIIWIISFVILNDLFLPSVFNFFLSFQTDSVLNTFNLFFEAKITEYVDFYISIFNLWTFNNSILVLMFFYLYTNRQNLTILKTYRKFFYFIIILISTLITPPDILSQLFTSFVNIVLLELLIFNILLKINLEAN